MALKVLEGTFTADGNSDTFAGRKFTFWLGTEGSAGFDGGTIKLWSRGTDAVKFSGDGISDDAYTLEASYTSASVVTSIEYTGLSEFYLELDGATSPTLAYKIHVEE